MPLAHHQKRLTNPESNKPLQGPAKEMLGEEAAAQGLAVQLKRKEEGAKWCDCEACTAATQILAKFGRIEL